MKYIIKDNSVMIMRLRILIDLKNISMNIIQLEFSYMKKMDFTAP